MSSNENDPRRNRNRDRDHDHDHDRFDEHNPFIAFRRFADSQVSSLMNTVFTLPTTIANYRNVHVAREHCLFGRADKAKCKQLHELEDATAWLVAEICELYRAGNLEEALERGQMLLSANHATDKLSKEIVEGGRGSSFADALGRDGESNWTHVSSHERDGASRTDLVERVANEKGQQWGWSWDWGFPRPFDADEDISSRREKCSRWHRRREESTSAMAQADQRSDAPEECSMHPEQHGRVEQQQRFLHQLDEALLPIFQELFRRESPDSDDVYSMAADPRLAAEMARAGVSRDAFEDLLRSQEGLPLLPREKLGQADRLPYDNWSRRFFDQTDDSFVGRRLAKDEYPKRVPWEGEDTAEEPNYEYSHDHEDQHDDPPSPNTKQGSWPSGAPETELEAYERLLGPVSSFGVGQQTEGRPSVLSTLTTTERTVHPDGTVTTKVVLKKRFNDGREESSETVHTERGQESHEEKMLGGGSLQDQPRKKAGWFWSS